MRLFLLLFLLFCSPAWAALEDFSSADYVENDEGADITKASPDNEAISYSSYQPAADQGWVGKDFGSGFFGDFTHTFSHTNTSAQFNVHINIWGISNQSAGDSVVWDTNDDGIRIRYTGSNDNWTLESEDNGNNATAIDLDNATYYGTIERSGETCTLTVYTDEARTTEATGSPQQATCGNGTKQYFYPLACHDTGTAAVASGVVFDYELNTGGGGGGRTRRMIN